MLKKVIGWVVFVLVVIGGLYAYDYYRVNNGQSPITFLKINNYKNYDKINIRGLVENITISSDGKIATMVVKANVADADTDVDYASIKVDKDTIITKEPYKEKFSLGEIKKGNTVEVTFSGPVLESYPVQAIAKHVTILD